MQMRFMRKHILVENNVDNAMDLVRKEPMRIL